MQCIDSTLWVKIKLGDSDALNQLYDRYIDVLYDFGKNHTNDEDCIRDSIHDLFLDIYKYRKKLSNADNIKYYLFASLKRGINKKLKAKLKFIPLDHKKNGIISDYETAEESIIKSEKLSEIKISISNALASLTNRQQKGLLLKFNEDRSYEEIALILDISIESVRTLIYRALKKLRNEIEV